MRDKLSIRAKKEGYRARSAYKLIELNKKYRIIKQGDKVLDIGAAPGSWMQVSSKLVGPEGFVLGIDINYVKEISENVKFLKLDVYKDVSEIKKYIKKVDVVLCDISPNTTGLRLKDQEDSIDLSMRAFNIGKKFLKNDGNFLCKVFQGPGFEDFYKKVGKSFNFFKSAKPSGSKKRSKEIYVVGLGFKK